ncbi:MAG: hypothetical protein N5P05_000863 [Chroococcopsis gigantea SAG 12.99]|jgi:Uma2 family endonuclease|nr:Uma2 family endonuclease [Chlorogloea purpurea SAG 13.99]MDV2999257.1 hypothetical protein [Chroococcopsis gigantea SAG 12.99]
MVAEPLYPRKMTPEAYLTWEAEQEYRHEYIDGEILAMTGGSIPHTKIYLNLYRALYSHLSQRGCEAYVADVKVKDQKNDRYFYPDLVITCDSEDLQARDFVQSPTVIVEVLSPSTANYDRSRKFKCYQQLETLREYILIDSESIFVEIYRRGEGRTWLYQSYGADENMIIVSVEFEVPLQTLYEGIVFDDKPIESTEKE